MRSDSFSCSIHGEGCKVSKFFYSFGKLDMDSMVDNEIIYSICKRNPLHREVHLHQSEQTAVDGPLDVEVPLADAVNALVVHHAIHI